MKSRMLIVDDDEWITQQLYWTFCDDYDVVTATDMRTAVRRATMHAPHVSILDLHLEPKSDCTDTSLRIIAFIKAHVPHSKILVMSTQCCDETEKTCYSMGVDAVLQKPFDTQALRVAMRRFVFVQI